MQVLVLGVLSLPFGDAVAETPGMYPSTPGVLPRVNPNARIGSPERYPSQYSSPRFNCASNPTHPSCRGSHAITAQADLQPAAGKTTAAADPAISKVAGIRRFAALLLLAGAISSTGVAQAAEDAPWRAFGRGPVLAPQTEGPPRAPGALCTRRPALTGTHLDRAELPPRAVAVVTPALAQAAGLASMIHPEQRVRASELIAERLQAAGLWTAEAEDGLFEYLLRQAEAARKKADFASGTAGAVAGGLLGMLGGRILDDVTGGYGTGSQGAFSGYQNGSRAARQLIPTEFVIRQDERSLIAVVDALLARPCDLSGGDALRALRAP